MDIIVYQCLRKGVMLGNQSKFGVLYRQGHDLSTNKEKIIMTSLRNHAVGSSFIHVAAQMAIHSFDSQ